MSVFIEVKESSLTSSFDLIIEADDTLEFYWFKESFVSYFISGMLRKLDLFVGSQHSALN